MEQATRQYVVSIQAQPFRKKTRYHWMICLGKQSRRIGLLGTRPDQELAETEARNEVRDLTSGLTQGGRVASTCYTAIHHC